jgi:hypothetical protein
VVVDVQRKIRHPVLRWMGATLDGRVQGSDAIHPTEPGDQSVTEKAGLSEVDKSVLAFPEPRRIRDRDHVRHVIKQPCLVCGRRPLDPHHLGFAQSRALGRKVSDEFTVPLCRAHHCKIHAAAMKACGGERRE